MNESLKQLSELEIEAVSGGETTEGEQLQFKHAAVAMALGAPEVQPPGETPGPLPTM